MRKTSLSTSPMLRLSTSALVKAIDQRPETRCRRLLKARLFSYRHSTYSRRARTAKGSAALKTCESSSLGIPFSHPNQTHKLPLHVFTSQGESSYQLHHSQTTCIPRALAGEGERALLGQYTARRLNSFGNCLATSIIRCLGFPKTKTGKLLVTGIHTLPVGEHGLNFNHCARTDF